MASFRQFVFVFIFAVTLPSLLVLAQDDGNDGDDGGILSFFGNLIGGIMDAIRNAIRGGLGLAGNIVGGVGDGIKGIGEFIKPDPEPAAEGDGEQPAA